jgi:hypothetical protein
MINDRFEKIESGKAEQRPSVKEIQKGFWEHASNGVVHGRRTVTRKVCTLTFGY